MAAADSSTILATSEQRNRQAIVESPGYLEILVFMEKFKTPMGLFDYSLNSLEAGLTSHNEVFYTLGMHEMYFQFLKRINICKCITRNRIIRFMAKFASAYGLGPLADTLTSIDRYEQLEPGDRILLLKAVIDAQLDDNSRLKAYINDQASESMRSQPIGKRKDGIAYWFFQDADLCIRLYSEDLTSSDRTVALVASDHKCLISTLEGLITDIELQSRFAGWLPQNLPDRADLVVRMMMESCLELVVSSQTESAPSIRPSQRFPSGPVSNSTPVSRKRGRPPTEGCKAKPKRGRKPKMAKRLNPKRKAADSMKDSSEVESCLSEHSDFVPCEYVKKEAEQTNAAFDAKCYRCKRSDSDEIVLLCDSCNDAYHPCCLRPQLVDIPEGDWFCPLCEQRSLCEVLCMKVIAIDQRILEERRKKEAAAVERQNRLANIAATMDNLILQAQMSSTKVGAQNKQILVNEDDMSSPSRLSDRSSGTPSPPKSAVAEAGREMRRTRAKVDYRFNKYDAAIKDAIGEASDSSELDNSGDDIRGRRKRRKSTDADFVLEPSPRLRLDNLESSSRGSQSESLTSSDQGDETWLVIDNSARRRNKRALKRRANRRRTKRGRGRSHSLEGSSSDGGSGRMPKERRHSARVQRLKPRNYCLHGSSDEDPAVKRTGRKAAGKARIIDSDESSGSQAEGSRRQADDANDLLWQRRVQLMQYAKSKRALDGNADRQIIGNDIPVGHLGVQIVRPGDPAWDMGRSIHSPLNRPSSFLLDRKCDAAGCQSAGDSKAHLSSLITRARQMAASPLPRAFIPNAIRTTCATLSSESSIESPLFHRGLAPRGPRPQGQLLQGEGSTVLPDCNSSQAHAAEKRGDAEFGVWGVNGPQKPNRSNCQREAREDSLRQGHLEMPVGHQDESGSCKTSLKPSTMQSTADGLPENTEDRFADSPDREQIGVQFSNKRDGPDVLLKQ